MLLERLRWLVRLRWFAAVVILVAVWIASRVFQIIASPGFLYVSAGWIAAYNLPLHFVVRQRVAGRRESHNPKALYALASVQISLDFVALALLLYFSGGTENPFTNYFVFHMILACILLPRKDVYFQLGLAVLLISAIVILENLHMVPHPHLSYMPPVDEQSPVQAFILMTAYVSTIVVAAYLRLTVTGRLTKKEGELARAYRSLETAHQELRAQTEEIRAAHEELRSTQQQLLHTQKLEAVGTLAAGVAHDFNNSLAAIVGHCEMLLHDLQARDHKRSDVEAIRQIAGKAGGLTRQLLAFSRKQQLQPSELELNALIGEIESVLRPLLGDNIELATQLSPGLGRIKADRGQVEQIITNLAVNARDAMPDGGEFVITTENVTADDESVAGSSSPNARNYVMMRLSDTGIGMDQQTLSRVFEPFFTTKEASTGAGLGLSMVHGIVAQSDGYIDVQSQPGRGTTSTIRFPRIDHVHVRPPGPEATPP